MGIRGKKVKCTKKFTHTHSNLSNEVDSKSKQTELTYNETQFSKIPIQRETFSFYLPHRSKNQVSLYMISHDESDTGVPIWDNVSDGAFVEGE